MCLLLPINTPNDTLNKACILSLVFALLFMLFFSVKGSKQRGYSPPNSIRQEFFEVNAIPSSFSLVRTNLHHQRPTVVLPHTHPLAGVHMSQEATSAIFVLGSPCLVFNHLMRAIGWILICPGWLRTSKDNNIHSLKTQENKDTEFSRTEK